MDEFVLKSFCLGAGEIDCKYRTTETDNEVTTEQEYHVKVTRPAHADLENLFKKDLAAVVAHIFDNTEDIAALELLDNLRVEPNGISFAGKDENLGIIIKGVRHTKFGDVKFTTPRIKFLAGDNEVCARLTVFAQKAIEEIKAYLFEGKQAEMQIFGE